MSLFVKIFQFILIVLLIITIVLCNPKIFSLDSLIEMLKKINDRKNKLFSYDASIYKNININKNIDKFTKGETEYDSVEMFNTEFYVTEDANNAISDALKDFSI